MKRLFSASIIAGFLLGATTIAIAQPPTKHHRSEYNRDYHRVAAEFGKRAPGRDILKDGTAKGAATDAEVRGSIDVLRRMLAPAPPQPVSAPVSVAPVSASPAPVSNTVPDTQTTVSQPVSASSGAGGVPACASESGTNYSTGPDNTNASSGATGRYQITPGTSAAYGCDLSTAAGQDACAQTIYANQGAGAWVGCGG